MSSPGPDEFYRRTARVLDDAGISFLVGGAAALRFYTGIVRDTKDLDFMIRPADAERALSAFREDGLQAGMVFSHWLAKVRSGPYFVDIIFSSGNGLCPVDDLWFANAREARLWERPAWICPVEELIWQKAFIMERERFDGADVAHLMKACGMEMDWPRLLVRFGRHYRVLLSHLVLFGFVYPSDVRVIPKWFLQNLAARTIDEYDEPAPPVPLCNGPLLSRAQYLGDLTVDGTVDGRSEGPHAMTREQIAAWTAAIDRDP
ncbi:MAG: hypothetical protein SFU53_13590 [Terrimicrobiaceae bacterium]|nr:hypothetical protein [Terrimicrobiaceae bacterium]